MSETGQRPPRTRAVAALDLVLDGLAAIRRLALAPVRLAADPRAGRLLTRGMIVAAVVVTVGTGLVIAALLRAPDGFAPMDVGPDPEAGAASPTGPTRAGIGPNSAASVTPHPSVSASTRPAAPAPETARTPPGEPAALTAEYTTEQRALVGYHGALEIANPGSALVEGWTVLLTLPRRTLSIADVRGATATQDGATWTFLPDRVTREVPAGGRVRVTFRVDGAALGATAPTGCTVNGRPCDGEFAAPAAS